MLYDIFGDKMILTFDVGNTDIVLVGYQNETIVLKSRLQTKSEAFDSYYLDWLKEIISNDLIKDIKGIIVGSVVPKLTKRFINLLENYFSLKVTTFEITQLPDFKALIDNPFELGTDLIAGGYGGAKAYQGPLIIVDAGSATKVSLINEVGNFVGCTISPGLGMSKEVMLSNITHLPTFDFKLPTSILGKNTIDSLQAGLLFGAIGSINYIADLYSREVKQPVTKILTGGYGFYLKEGLKDYIYLPDLVNEGLLKIYETLKESH